jgi:hypothetical protein
MRPKAFNLPWSQTRLLTGGLAFAPWQSPQFFWHYMKELFSEWAELQARRARAALNKSLKLEHLAKEIQILEKLLVNGFYNIPGENRDVRSILENRQQQWRDMQKPE